MDAQTLPYHRIGGDAVIARIVDRFYDLMDGEPQYAELRAIHAPDLAPMRASLTGFLIAWLGGPQDWFTDRPGACVMSAHGNIRVTPETARQWLDAMARAFAETGVGPDVAAMVGEAFTNMAQAMARRDS
ncbi:hemoglobin [Sphingomonas laterariae]|uniref:Hemoglobin n=1 Tax=Edaphosphingomonas laterariae TaxID=861865 RepID=A0A239FFX6_9SPHN|nr:hemoglobin [Sphingomonas laterariae]